MGTTGARPFLDASCVARVPAGLQGANSQLRERLAEALDELNAAHAQLCILQDLQRQLEDATPGAADLVAAGRQCLALPVFQRRKDELGVACCCQ